MDNQELREKKQKIKDLIYDPLYVSMKAKEIAVLLEIPKENREDLAVVLEELVKDGKIECTEKGKYQKVTEKFVEGQFIANARGFGFVTVVDEDEDYFIPEKYVMNAFHHDMVRIMIMTSPVNGHRTEGKVVEILGHEITEVVGTYQASGEFGFVICDDKKLVRDIFVPKAKSQHAVTGHKVVCRIINYGSNDKNPEGVITEILGHVNDPGVDILSIVRAYSLPMEFSDEVLEEAKATEMEVSEKEEKGRKDLRSLKMVTIDGDDSKDLDDAVSIERQGNNYVLGVHIADVSHYVTENSALDEEAKKRGTSVYLVDRVIPMLPHALSNDICSLNEGVDRLALSCFMTISPSGKVIDHEITESVICSNHRMTYHSVNLILEDHDPEEMDKYQDMCDDFFLMGELADLLRKQRRKRGSIDFDFPESKIILDDLGRPIDVSCYERHVANKMIEEFMLLANETVAEHFFWANIPFLYRTHAAPDPEKMKTLATFIGNFGFTIHGNMKELHPMELQALLSKIEGSPQEDLISRLTLRSMQQARYTVECSGHFGLALEYYSHFTSPIRRYPDLQIHRIMKESMHNKLNHKRLKHYEALLPLIATSTSKDERRANEIEREVDKMKKVEYMHAHLGEEFIGVISGVIKWGMYIELPNTCEGFVSLASMTDDHYFYIEESYELVGEHKNVHYKLGDSITVIVAAAQMETRTIDFTILGMKIDKSNRSKDSISSDRKKSSFSKTSFRKSDTKKKTDYKKGMKKDKKNVKKSNKAYR